MIGMLVVVVAAFAAGMVALDLFIRVIGAKILLPEDSFVVRFWRERKDEDLRTLCEVILLLTASTVGNILGVALLLFVLATPVMIVMGALETGREYGSSPTMVAEIAIAAVAAVVLVLALWAGMLIGGIKVAELAEERFGIFSSLFRTVSWPFRKGAQVYRTLPHRPCPLGSITEA